MSKENLKEIAPQEMTAVEYFRVKARMTKTNEYITCDRDCKDDCVLSICNNPRDKSCIGFEMLYPEEAVAIVQKWAEEHPIRTRQSEFLKIFPNTPKYNDFLDICPAHIEEISKEDCKLKSNCIVCKKDFWLAELPETEVQDE